jgi:hypothetical protein
MPDLVSAPLTIELVLCPRDLLAVVFYLGATCVAVLLASLVYRLLRCVFK